MEGLVRADELQPGDASRTHGDVYTVTTTGTDVTVDWLVPGRIVGHWHSTVVPRGTLFQVVRTERPAGES